MGINDVVNGEVLIMQSVKSECYFRVSGSGSTSHWTNSSLPGNIGREHMGKMLLQKIQEGASIQEPSDLLETEVVNESKPRETYVSINYDTKTSELKDANNSHINLFNNKLILFGRSDVNSEKVVDEKDTTNGFIKKGIKKCEDNNPEFLNGEAIREGDPITNVCSNEFGGKKKVLKCIMNEATSSNGNKVSNKDSNNNESFILIED